MKPISLKLSGLQSYREMQEIDFTELCDVGLFGIFGPTGSGKSTILDAITLALYGKVGRAHSGTQGIMNHSEDSLFVSFTFELSSASGKERYRAERRFKRTNEWSVSNTISRFIEISPGEERVLADKLTDVTKAVEDKIGLKMDDFTRAVVLPQGKFAEFLSKGADRRQMLQRLFHLEKYGDGLALKLQRKVKETDQKLREVSAEQLGLGDASEQALLLADQAVKDTSEQADAARVALVQAEKQSEQLGKIRELSIESKDRTAQLALLRNKEEEIVTLEAKLVHCAAANEVHPIWVSWKEAHLQAATRERAAVEAQQTATAAMSAVTSANEALEVAAANRAKEEPVLLVRLDQLEQAKTVQSACNQLLDELGQLRTSLEQCTQRKELITDDLQKNEILHTKAQERKLELEKQLEQCEVKVSERQRIQAAVQLANDLRRAKAQLHKAEAESSELYKQTEATAVNMQKGLADEQLLRDQCRLIAQQGTQLTHHLSIIQGALVQLLTLGAQLQSKLRVAMKDKEQSIWIHRLKEQLEDGNPCPVCGSVHVQEQLNEDRINEESLLHPEQLEEATSLLAEITHMKFTLAANMETAASLTEQAMSLTDSKGEDQPLSNVHLNEIAVSAQFPDDEATSLDQLKQKVQLYSEEIASSQSQIESMQQQLRSCHKSIKETESSLAAIRADASGKTALLEQMRRQADRYRQEEGDLLKQWNDNYSSDLSLETIDELQANMASKDQQSEEIKQRLVLSVPFIEEKNELLSQLAKQLNELDKEVLQLQMLEQGKKSLLEEKESQLKGWIGAQSIDQLLSEVKEQLEKLIRDVEVCQRSQVSLAARSNEAAQAAALAVQAAEAAKQQEEILGDRWLKVLEDSPFDSGEEVANAFIEPQLVKEYEQLVHAHREREQELTRSIKELEDKLGGRNVTDEEWGVAVETLNMAKKKHEEALQIKARAQRDYEDLAGRHERYSKLESIRVTLAREAELLGKLQSSLRGNAFVEYVAEEQLLNVSHAASERLRQLTKQRYSLELDSVGGFVICDESNGGVKRPVATLSGGETFLTSLALALALSAQIQLRGQYPLQFFFLDEGFGTLDPELLDTVITSLEHLHDDHLSVGIISHVAELRSRLARKLIVLPAESGGVGSKVVVERL